MYLGDILSCALNCRCNRFPFTSQMQADPSKLALASHRPPGEKRAANIGPFSTSSQQRETEVELIRAYIVLGVAEIEFAICIADAKD